MIAWRDKLRAAAIHFAATLLLAAVAAVLYRLWFPPPFHEMVGGTKLFLLLVGCDLALGPLISLVIYDRRKSRRELYTDYTVVGLVQLAALAYGLHTAHSARPVFVVFATDRLEVVTAGDIPAEELAAASPRHARLPQWGLAMVAVEVPEAERQAALFRALEGVDTSLRPRFYVPYANAQAAILARAGSLAALRAKHPEADALLREAVATTGRGEDALRWLPVKAKEGFWTALLDARSAVPLGYVPLDPY